VRDLRERLHLLARQYGVHICGEGGEYESFTLDCPLFHQRIVLDDCATVVHSDDSFAPVLYLRCNRFHLEDKPTSATTRLPATASSSSDAPRAFLRRRDGSSQRTTAPPSVLAGVGGKTQRCAQFCVMLGVCCVRDGAPLVEQAAAVFQYCFENLDAGASVAYVTLYLDNMSDYALVNEIYNEFFDADPPARCAVAIGVRNMPHMGSLLSLDVITTTLPVATLHVQSISEWAPACIGPYSQAKSIGDSVLLLAGQIGLDPATMTLVSPRDVAAQFRVAHSNCVAVASLICDCDAVTACRRFQHVFVYHTASVVVAELRALAVQTFSCSFTFIGVDALPKGALVELQVIARRREFPTIRVQVGDENLFTSGAMVLSCFQTTAHAAMEGAGEFGTGVTVDSMEGRVSTVVIEQQQQR
jgi:diphthine-ammonia ligase